MTTQDLLKAVVVWQAPGDGASLAPPSGPEAEELVSGAITGELLLVHE
jgi:hypothetical protein